MKISTLMAVVLVTLFSVGAAMADTGGGGGMPATQNMGLPNGGTVEVPQIVPFESVPPSF